MSYRRPGRTPAHQPHATGRFVYADEDVGVIAGHMSANRIVPYNWMGWVVPPAVGPDVNGAQKRSPGVCEFQQVRPDYPITCPIC